MCSREHCRIALGLLPPRAPASLKVRFVCWERWCRSACTSPVPRAWGRRANRPTHSLAWAAIAQPCDRYQAPLLVGAPQILNADADEGLQISGQVSQRFIKLHGGERGGWWWCDQGRSAGGEGPVLRREGACRGPLLLAPSRNPMIYTRRPGFIVPLLMTDGHDRGANTAVRGLGNRTGPRSSGARPRALLFDLCLALPQCRPSSRRAV
jgi:hypothetical protein